MLGQGKFRVRVGVRVSLGLRVRIIVRIRISPQNIGGHIEFTPNYTHYNGRTSKLNAECDKHI